MNSLKSLVKEYSGFIFTNFEYLKAIKPAQQKLNRIIELYGDADGERRMPYYLAQLIFEEIASSRMMNSCIGKSRYNMEKECVAEANAPSI